MCGIAGFAGAGSRSDLMRMTDALSHRGPDGAGHHIDTESAVFLGHRRLAIVDLTGGDQPMWNEDGTVGVVFNGEIYNHAELRQELVRRGHKFASHHSDTEVLVHGYEEWGEGLPLRLNGMFAFAIYDSRRAQLFLARDRFGEKPLYYSAGPKVFAFASELDALAAHGCVSRSLSQRALQKLFAYGYLPAPHAFLAGSNSLPAGNWLRVDLKAGRFTPFIRQYWRFRIETDDLISDDDEPALTEELASLLRQAARRRLMSDVPLGVFLSGGLDSSVVLASLTAEHAGETFDTFTIGFVEPSFDESAYARVVAKHFGTRHHEKMLSMEAARDLIPHVLSRLDEPLGDPSILPTSMLSQFARQHVTVALSGDGGDELFAGYDPFMALAPAVLYSRMVPDWGHSTIRTLVDLLPISNANMSLDFKLRRTTMGLSYAQSVWLPAWMSPVEPTHLADLLTEPVRIEDVYDEAITLWDADPKKPIIDRALEFFTNLYLPDNILRKADRASMMHSLETRAVFLDNDLVEFCRRLPHRFKLRNGERKYLLKKAARKLLPDEIIDRKKKGFGIPIASWLKDIPPDPPLHPIEGARLDWASKAWDDHRRGKRDWRLFLWTWLSLQETAVGYADRGVVPARVADC